MSFISFVVITLTLIGSTSFSNWAEATPKDDDINLSELKKTYSQPTSKWPAPFLKKEIKSYLELGALKKHQTLDPTGKRKAKLGKRLFEDPALSASNQIACQNCHNQELGWGDGLQTSFGHNRLKGKRNAPSLFSSSYRKTLFWDGRAIDLPSQAIGPLTAPDEMANQDLDLLTSKLDLDPDYVTDFAEMYEPKQPIQLTWVLDALRVFQSSLERTTRFDRFMSGDPKQLNEQEIYGLHLFRTKAGCANCHQGPLLTDEKFHNIGLSYYGRKFEDLGRYQITNNPADAGKFRTPSLRHIKKTGPYMHNGLFPSLRGIINLYARGGGRVSQKRRKSPNDQIFEEASKISSLITKFKLNREEHTALVAFLKTL